MMRYLSRQEFKSFFKYPPKWVPAMIRLRHGKPHDCRDM